MTIKTGAVANNQPNNQIIKSGGFDLVKISGMSREEVEIIRNTVAKNTTDGELAYFFSVAKSVNLSPIAKEIWCYKDNRGNVLVFAGRDGFRSIAQRNERFVDMNSVEVCAKDNFRMGLKDGKPFIEHDFSNKEPRGDIIGAYCVINLTNGGQVVEWADIKDYDKKQFTWTSHKSEMIRKVAEIHAIKKMSNLRGIYAEEEFKINDGVVMEAEVVPVKTNADSLREVVNEPTKLITDEQKILLQDEVERVGKSMAGLLEYMKHSDITEITYNEANSWITALSKQPDKKPNTEQKVEIIKPVPAQVVKAPNMAEVSIGEVIGKTEELPKKGLEELRKKMQNLKVKPKEEKVVVLPEDVVKVVNILADQYQVNNTCLDDEEMNLLIDLIYAHPTLVFLLENKININYFFFHIQCKNIYLA